MMKSAFLLGTSHDFQRPSHPKAAQFRAVAHAPCVDHGVSAIAEEMSLDGLRSETESVCKQIADVLHIAHRYCDPSADERKSLGVVEDDDIRMSGFFKNGSPEQREAKVRESWAIREQFWLHQLLTLDYWPVLFVCGANHTERFRELLAANGIVAHVLFTKWTPEGDVGKIDAKTVHDVMATFAKLGGKARAKKLTHKRRKEIAKKAARARWSKTGGST